MHVVLRDYDRLGLDNLPRLCGPLRPSTLLIMIYVPSAHVVCPLRGVLIIFVDNERCDLSDAILIKILIPSAAILLAALLIIIIDFSRALRGDNRLVHAVVACVLLVEVLFCGLPLLLDVEDLL